MRDLESIEHLRVWSTESGPPEHMECSLQEISVSKLIRVIFVWPWNENAQTNGNRLIWSACLRDKIAFGFWLVKRTLSWKNFMPKELFTNQSILPFDVMLQHQSNNSFSILGFSLAGSSCFDLFIHWLIKQIMNIYQNHFSRSYENRSNHMTAVLVPGNAAVKNKKECSRGFPLIGVGETLIHNKDVHHASVIQACMTLSTG